MHFDEWDVMSIDACADKPFDFYNNYQRSIFLILVLFGVGMFFSSLIPPFQSPDEEDHLKRAYFLSQGRIAMETPSGQSTGGLIDAGLSEFIANYRPIAGNQQKKLTLDVQQKAGAIQWSGKEQFVPCPGVNYYFPLIYAPQAAGLFVGRMLDLTVSQSYYLARYTALLSSLIVIFIGFFIRKPSVFNIAILVMPLVLFQLVSTSQDGFAMALVILAGSLFLSISSSKNEFKKSHFYSMCGVILLLSTSRINLVPMLIMPFAASYLVSKPLKNYLISAAVTVLSFVWILYALATTVDNRIEKGDSTVDILTYYLKDPIAFIEVLVNTLQNDQTINFYVASFIGVLGWLDTSIGDTYIVLILCSLIVIFLLSISIRSLKKELYSRGILFLVAFTSILLTFFLLLITWNKHPAEIIQGVQGRYFWASVILLGLSVTNVMDNFSRLRKAVIIVALLLVVLISVSVMPRVLLSRYFMSNTSTIMHMLPIELKENAITILPKDANMKFEPGGFVDTSEYKDGTISIVGWGYFDSDEKVFLTNKTQSFPARYLTIERPDVVNVMGESKFIYAGFEINIPVENEVIAKEIMDGFCLYSNHPSYGIKQFISGGSNKLYKCGLTQ